MATVVSICNRGLSRIGHTISIQALDEEGSVEAEQSNLHFEDCRDEALEAFPWNFATKRATLAIVAGAERTDWEYVYALPTDCLAVRFLVREGVRNPSAAERVPFHIEANDAGDGRILVTDLEDAELVYTMKHVTPGVWPPAFVSALAWRLAAELALGVKKDRALAKDCLVAYGIALQQAEVLAANERQRELPPTTPSIAARR